MPHSLSGLLLEALLSEYRRLCGMPRLVLLQLVAVLDVLEGDPVPLYAAHLIHHDSVNHLVGGEVHLEVHHVPLLLRHLPEGLRQVPVARTQDTIGGVVLQQVVVD